MGKSIEELREYYRKYRQEYRKKNPNYQKQYYALNKERTKSYQKKYRATEEGARKVKSTRLQKLYGITLEDYEAMVKKQNGLCAICLGLPTTIKGHRTFSVDHCHKTKRVRGLLCHPCNIILGNARDNTKILATAILYLEKNNEFDPGTRTKQEEGW